MTLAPVRHLTPSISVSIEQQSDNRPNATKAVAARFRQVAAEIEQAKPILAHHFDQTAWKLARCAQAGKTRAPFRCGHTFCPRCARQRAIRYRKRLDARLGERVGAGAAHHGFALLTLGVAATDPRSGLRSLRSAMKMFFRRRLFRWAVVGGEVHIQAEAARGDDSGQRWNIHAHALVELGRPMRGLDLTGLQGLWAEVLNRRGERGSFHLRQGSNLQREFFTNGGQEHSSCP